jgi:Tfp pilus assembly protein PilF
MQRKSPQPLSAAGAAAQRRLRAALAHRSRQEWEPARAALQAALHEAAVDAGASAAVGDLCSSLAEYELAFAAYDRAIRLRADRPVYWFNRAAVRRSLGQLAQAEDDYDRCLALDPRDAQAHLNRAHLRTQTWERNHVGELERLLAHAPAAWQTQVPLRFALAKEYEDLGEHARAWFHLAAGSWLRRRHLQYDPAADRQTVDALIQAFPAALPRPCGDPSAAPIFVLGLPRAGSSLVDRLLGSHAQVRSAGELVHFGHAVADAARACAEAGAGAGAHSPAYAVERAPTRRELIAACTGLDFAALGADYLARTRALTAMRPRFTDALPLNHRYCGLIDAALPNAPIVHVTRHPMATCYGLYQVLFDEDHPFSYDLGEIADYYIGYRRLMAHWHAVLPGRIIEVAYEDLVAAPQAQCRRLFAAVGLPWDAACVDFDDQAAPTASASSARPAISAGSVDQWRHYAAQLEPVRRRLEAAGIATG